MALHWRKSFHQNALQDDVRPRCISVELTCDTRHLDTHVCQKATSSAAAAQALHAVRAQSQWTAAHRVEAFTEKCLGSLERGPSGPTCPASNQNTLRADCQRTRSTVNGQLLNHLSQVSSHSLGKAVLTLVAERAEW